MLLCVCVCVCVSDCGVLSAVQIFVCLLVAFSYPLQSHPCRKCVMSLLDNTAGQGQGQGQGQRGAVTVDYRYRLRYIVITVSEHMCPSCVCVVMYVW